jgi:hypothetical protein
MTDNRFEFTAFDCAYITDHEKHKDYPFVDKPEYIQEIVDLLNEQDQKIKELEQELFAEKVQRLDERLAEYGGPDDEKVWQEEFGMSQREAKKKAGWSDWCYYPE